MDVSRSYKSILQGSDCRTSAGKQHHLYFYMNEALISTVHRQTNCLTETLFLEAFQRAKELDDHLERTGSPVGPLHGLPISLKDCLITPPYPSSIGMTSYANSPTTSESETLIVTILKSLGAIPYAKTNTPVAMMMMESVNHIWGSTVNPCHTGLSAGGSSGGESALLAMRGSPLGVGTDIGGSIRIPAAFCGLYGLRPTSGKPPHPHHQLAPILHPYEPALRSSVPCPGRFTTYNTRSGIPGQEVINSVNGPMSRSLSSLILYSSAILSSSTAQWTLDPKIVPISWRPGPHIQPRSRPLRIALAGPSDGVVRVHPPVERALNLTRQALEKAGHEVIDWDYGSEYQPLIKLVLEAFLDFGGTAIISQLEPHSEPVFPAMSAYADAAAAAKTPGTGLTGDKLREMCIQRNKLAKHFLDRWNATADGKEGKGVIDGLICPVSPWAACRLDVINGPVQPMSSVNYTAWVNALDLPSCTFPVTKADRKVDGEVSGASHGNGGFLNELDRNVQGDWDAEFYDGAPVALQLIGERFGEEKVLEVVGRVRDALVENDGVRR